MSENEGNPLVEALPPASDYMTYLTIVEKYLTKDNLPLMHDLLQDERLTTNIGWDLVHVLLRLLPESEQCLDDVACMGNPREVVLKVTELLEELSVQISQLEYETEDEDAEAEDQNEPTHKDICAKFQCLLHMLCVLHPRIKTKYPSRFLKTSAETISRVYSKLSHFPSATRSVLMFLRSLSGSKRPGLPPRKTEEAIPTVKSTAAKADPEGDAAPDPSEVETSRIILRVLATQVARHCVEGFTPVEGASGVAWVERYNEKRNPSKIVPHRSSYTDLFQREEELYARTALLSQLLYVTIGDLQTPWSALVHLITPDSVQSEIANPLKVENFPPSPTGALYLLATQSFVSLIQSKEPPHVVTLPAVHSGILTKFIGSPDSTSLGVPGPATTPPALVDALLILGWAGLTTKGLDSDPSAAVDEDFHKYLQSLTLVAATHYSPSLRYQAHEFAGAVLAAHKSGDARKAFLKDTLEHCPYENIKASAVAWVKNEFLQASRERAEGSKVWSNKETLTELAPLLFPPQAQDVDMEDLIANAPLYISSLNLLYLLCDSKDLNEPLRVTEALADVGATFVVPLKATVDRVLTVLSNDGDSFANDAFKQSVLMDVTLLDEAIRWAQKGLETLKKI